MKKILILILTVMCAAVAAADTRSGELLSALSSKIGGFKSGYQVKFRVAIQGQGAVDGEYIVSGDKFYIKIENREIYSNGRVKYEVNGDDREVVVDNVNPNDKDILTNPTRAFEFLGGNFVHSYTGRGAAGARACEVVVLKPTAKGTPYSDITLMIDRANGLPAQISYRMAELSSDVMITVLSFSERTELKESVFNFDKARYKGFEVIDFR